MLARDRIEAFHRRQLPEDDRYIDALGVELGIALDGDRGGRPLRARRHRGLSELGADERRPRQGRRRRARRHGGADARTDIINPLVLAAARLAGVDEVYRVGGAQAIAALAYGTATIAPVAKIVGPGNAYVAAAKRLVFGTVGIDLIAGPSEVLVVADGDNDPDWIAADLLAQAEHDAAAQSILVTDSRDLADRVAAAVERQLKTLPRAEIAAASWRRLRCHHHGRRNSPPPSTSPTASRRSISSSPSPTPRRCSASVRNAGAVFLGRHTPEVIGDYVGGPNHVLPTARSARFSSGLSVLDFVKRTSVLKLGAGSAARARPGGDHARRGGGPRTPMPARSRSGSTAEAGAVTGSTAAGRLVAVELDADGAGQAARLHRRRARRPRSAT